MSLFLDIGLCLAILSVVVGSRFNKWPAEQSKLFDGKPADYIDTARYRGFCFLYILTFFIISAVLYSFPEFLRFVPGWEDQQLRMSYTMCALIVVSALAQQNISTYDEQWRRQLHEWARIPGHVEEVSREIMLSDSYLPTESYLSALRQDLQREDQSLSYWINVISDIETEKEHHSIDWCFLKCASLMLIIRDTNCGPSADHFAAKARRIEELARLVPLTGSDEKEFAAYKRELEDLSRYFIESICKYLIKKYPRADEQFSAFKNLGFSIRQHDSAEVSIRDAIIWCSLGVVFVSVCSVTALLMILDARSEIEFLTQDRFILWTLGNIECFMIAIFVGILVKKMSARKAKTGMNVYVSAFFLATLASFIFFQFAQDLNTQSSRLPFARFMLAMSFSTLSIVVVRALSNISLDQRDVILSSLFHGLMLGLVMGVFQGLTSIAFSWGRIETPSSLMEFLSRDDWKLPLVCLVGLFKGLFVGVGISFFIHNIQRKQLLASLRQNPRVERVMVMTCKREGEQFTVSTKDISKHGIKIQTRRRLNCGDKITIESQIFGSIEGVIKWSRNLFWGRQQAGVQFIDTPHKLNKFLRDRYGEYYA
jgi:hypothetical protein